MELELRSLADGRKVKVALDRKGLRVKGYAKKEIVASSGSYRIGTRSFPNVRGKKSAAAWGLAGSLMVNPLIGLAAMTAKSAQAREVLTIVITVQDIQVLLVGKDDEGTLKAYAKMTGGK